MTERNDRPARSNNVIPVPVYHDDIYGSLRAAMFFPNDRAKAESFCAAHLMKGPVQNCLQAGHTLSGERLIALFNARDREISSNEIATQERHGGVAGEVVKSLWALICSHPDIASWERAIRVIQNQRACAGSTINRATLRACLSKMRPVLHLWGALALREHQWLDNPNVGYHRLDDLSAFMTEGMTLLHQLCIWRDHRKQPDLLLAGEMFGPWPDWEPHEPRPGWPRTGGIYCISFPPEVSIPAPRPPGRPPRKENPVQ
jgi:hypothetical protein